MATLCPLPDATKVADILGMLFDGIDVKPGGKFDETPAGGSWYGVYVKDSGETAALCGADTHLAASFGAALTMLSPGVAEEACEIPRLQPDDDREPARDMNICTGSVLDATSIHVRLDQVYPSARLPAPAEALPRSSHGRREFQLQVPKYGGGVLTVLTA